MGELTFEEVRKPRRYAPAFYHAFSLFWQQIPDYSPMARRRIFPWLWCFQTVSFYCILHGKHAIIIRRFI